jgi:hypothetical protein
LSAAKSGAAEQPALSFPDIASLYPGYKKKGRNRHTGCALQL